MKNKVLKRSSHPVMFFIYLSVFFIILSGILSALNFQATYGKLTTISGEVETTTAAVNSLLSISGLKFLLTKTFDNLINFAPFGSLLMAAIAIGIQLKSGFMSTLTDKLAKKIPAFLIVFIYSLLCIILSIDNNACFVLMLPLGAALFMSMNRNPIIGIALGFASAAAGHGAGLFINSLDYNLSSYTEASAKLIDSEYKVSQSGNLIFMIVASILIALVCAIITEKILLKKYGKNSIEEADIMIDEEGEKKGLIGALIATVVLLIPIVLMIIPAKGDGFLGLLLDKSQGNYAKMLFSNDALFMTNMVGILSLIVAVQSFVFGVLAGTIKKIRDMVNFSTDYLRMIGGIFVLIFFASQLCAIVTETNIGTVITANLANIIGTSNFSFIPLILLIFIFTIIANVFLPGSVAKWAILAPNIMNCVMKANVTPEFAQAVFRAGDSISNVITPLFIYFVIYIGFAEVYTKDKNDFGIRNCYRAVMPYFVGVTLVWLLLIICWYVIGLPIGPSIFPTA